MYLVALKTLLADSMASVFDADYVNPQFRNVHTSIEYPVDPQAYPGIWVDFEPQGDLEVVGVGHREFDGSGTSARKFTRWRYQGYATYTVAALSSLERDALYDEVVRIMAFGREQPQTSEFRSYIEGNDLIAANMDFDQIGQRGHAASPGTPWGTDEIVYEATLAMEVLGEFVNDSVTGTLIPISAIEVTHYPDTDDDPDPGW